LVVHSRLGTAMVGRKRNLERGREKKEGDSHSPPKCRVGTQSMEFQQGRKKIGQVSSIICGGGRKTAKMRKKKREGRLQQLSLGKLVLITTRSGVGVSEFRDLGAG